ncbi:MAG TPA: putative LPS assembly protein LptD [Daejeonella sp.]|nr:putative LPS assembly protein LptD [Daejeonella sp.]
MSLSFSAYAQQPALRPPAKSTSLPDTSHKSKSGTGLQAKVKYTAEDSIRIDYTNNVVYLYGKGRIIYEDFQIDADYIRLDQKNNTAFAKGYTDPKTNRYRGRPILKQGNEAPITTDSLIFNYQTKKGKSYGVFSDVDGGYLQAQQFKKNEFEEGFFKNGIYTTCNLLHPHFGIHITRGIVTEKQVVSGPAYLNIEDVPLPLGVPFGFFPKPNRRSGGLLLPTLGEDAQRGFYVRDLGYYFGLSDYWDLAIRGTGYSKGSFEGNALARYRKNYKYDGNFNFRYASTRNGIEGTPEFQHPAKDFNITWYHTQRPEANPGTTFSASVNAGTGKYFIHTAAGGTYNVDQLIRNTLSSNISYGKIFGNNGLFNFTSSLSHRQDLENQDIFLELPTFSLNMSTIQPLDNKNRIGEPKWYQKINVGYSLQGSNSINTKESLLFRDDALKKFTNGFQHNIPVSFSMNLFKYFQFNSGLQYNERWYLQTIRKSFSASTNRILTDTVPGFSRAYEYSLNSGLSTKFYGQLNFKKGKWEGIRHVFTPSVSMNYRPDFGANQYGYYKSVVVDSTGRTARYSIFENGIYGTPSAGKLAGISFAFDNNVEAKKRAKDSLGTAEKIPLLQNLTFSGSYNFAVDSFRLSPISFIGRTALFKQQLGINFNGTFDPYQLNQQGARINKFTLNNGKLARLTNFGLSFDISLNSNAVKRRSENLNQLGQNMQNATAQQAQELAMINRDPNAFVDFNVPWNVSASYSFNYSKFGLQSSITNTLNLFGDFNLTPKWKVQYTSGYDLQQKKLSLTQFAIYRDLHCWDMSFRWIPVGLYRSYSVDIRVKASILQDLKLSRRRDYFNNL